MFAINQRNNFFSLIFVFIAIFSFLFPAAANADRKCSGVSEGIGNQGFLLYHGSLVPCGRSCDDPETSVKEDQDCTLCHLLILLQNIFNLVISLVIVVALLFITAGGVLYIVSAGTPGMKNTAKGIITGTLKGIGVLVLSWLIVFTLLKFISVRFEVLGGGSEGNWYEFTCDTNSAFTSSGSGSGSGGSGTGSSEDSVGCGKIVDAAKQMKSSGCQYSQAQRNHCASYTDCSDFVDTAYKKASCSSPGNVSGTIGGKGEAIGEKSSLRAGDVLWVPGHVVICENEGCSTVIHASSEKTDIKESNGSYYLSKSGVKVVRASKYCGSCD